MDIGGNDAGFHFAGGGLLGRSDMVHRVDHGKELPCAPFIPHTSEGHCRPDGRMRILPAVFSDSRSIPFDVFWILCGPVKQRVQKLKQLVLAANQALIERFHGHA